MKKIILLFALLLTSITFAQVPQGISYQAIALNASGDPVASSTVGVRLSVLDNAANGTVIYTETHTKATNAQGLFNLFIGQGTPSSGNFSAINWGTNAKFLKVEIDVAGGMNYVLVGTTQLLSVPYALAADSLVTSAGEGITLVSPNGTPYQVTVSDNGELSLPTSGAASPSSPNNFYMYGSFNSFNPSTALLMANFVDQGSSLERYGYKYLTAGTELKFLATNNASSPVYGLDNTENLTINGNSYLVNNTGYYLISLYNGYGPDFLLNNYSFNATSITPQVYAVIDGSSTSINPTYSVANNKFTFIVNGVTNNYPSFSFYINSVQSPYFGDNLADGTIDQGGSEIIFPNLTAAPKNFRVELTLNFNGSGTYTIVQIP